METALETAKWLLGQVLNKLSDDLVKAYVSSTELGPNLDKIKTEMLSTTALLVAAQRRDVTGNPALQGLLEMLGKKAKEAENTLHELHHFMTRDKLDGTRYAAPELGDGLGAKAEHAHHAARHTADNWLSCLSCCCRRDDDDDNAAHACLAVLVTMAMLQSCHSTEWPCPTKSGSSLRKCTPIVLVSLTSSMKCQAGAGTFTRQTET